MTTDRTTKILLAAVAIGLWLNVIGEWMQPVPAHAQPGLQFMQIERVLRDMQRDINQIAAGLCNNDTIC